MARIPEAEIERLKSEVSVERLVEASGIELKKAGKSLSGILCVRHSMKPERRRYAEQQEVECGASD